MARTDGIEGPHYNVRMPSPASDESNVTPPQEAPSPRAFAQASGMVFQVAGWIMLFGGCCIGPVIGGILGSQEEMFNSPAEWWSQSPAHQRLVAVNILLLGVLGLALAVFGLGLSQERRHSDTACVVLTGTMAAAWWASTIGGVLLAFHWSKIVLILLNLGLALVATVFFVMALTSLRVMRLHPPPPDEPVTEEFLEALRHRRRPD